MVKMLNIGAVVFYRFVSDSERGLFIDITASTGLLNIYKLLKVKGIYL